MATPTFDTIRHKVSAAADAAVFGPPHRMLMLARLETKIMLARVNPSAGLGPLAYPRDD